LRETPISAATSCNPSAAQLVGSPTQLGELCASASSRFRSVSKSIMYGAQRMHNKLNGASGLIALALSGAAFAQAAAPAQQTTSTSTQQTPTQAQTTTTRSTTTVVPGTPAAPAQSETTTTRSTATTPTDVTGSPVGPTQSSTTTTTTTSSADAVETATAADVKSGVSVYDQHGGLVGKIESVSGANAVVNAGGTRAAIPVASFAKSSKGLVISMTRAELEASAKAAAKTTTTKTSTVKTSKKPK
jgi:hypothetical protein